MSEDKIKKQKEDEQLQDEQLDMVSGGLYFGGGNGTDSHDKRKRQ